MIVLDKNKKLLGIVCKYGETTKKVQETNKSGI